MANTSDTDPVLSDVLGWAKAFAAHHGVEQLDLVHVLWGALRSPAAADLLKAPDPALMPDPFIEALKSVPGPVEKKYDLSPQLKAITGDIWKREGRLAFAPVLKAVTEALVGDFPWAGTLFPTRNEGPGAGLSTSASPADVAGHSGPAHKLEEILNDVKRLRDALAGRVQGQGNAISVICDAYFAARLAGRLGGDAATSGRTEPALILTLVGPPGVGKTSLSLAVAEHLGDRSSVLTLDMTSYSTHQAHEQLVGASPFYSGSTEGLLTGFAATHPTGTVIIEAIDKAHANTQNLLLQVLDSALLYDNNRRKVVGFTGVTFIFTTNLGSRLYDAPETMGFLRDTQHLAEAVLEAVGTESGEQAGQQGLSADLLSRLGKGYVSLLDRLDGLALQDILQAKFRDISGELEQRTGVKLRLEGQSLPTLFLLRFGVHGDARRLVNSFSHFLSQALMDGIPKTSVSEQGAVLKSITFAVSPDADIPEEVAAILNDNARIFRILTIDDDKWHGPFPKWADLRQVVSREEADEPLRERWPDLVLLDLHIGDTRREGRIEQGIQMLRWLRARHPAIPVFLFSDTPKGIGLSPEALHRLSREGGARGVLSKPSGLAGELATEFFARLREEGKALRYRRLVEDYRRRFKSIQFDMLPVVHDSDPEALELQLVGIRDVRSVAAHDKDLIGWVDLPSERFGDVAGAEHAKERLAEVVNWLRDPTPIREMGLSTPKGILLTGPPGTGKTTLARAVAGESETPFFAISGSEVFSKWVGESEGQIRTLFTRARRCAPAIIFIDEIDSLGSRRGESDSGWRVGVLNELLAQMDGFVQGTHPIFVMAATNRADMLDPALLRAGRFDLHIEVPNPNASARQELFTIHLKGIPHGVLDLAGLVARTAGLSGADIRQICKEAGFLALRRGKKVIEQEHLEAAVSDVKFGLSSETSPLTPATRWTAAVHEAGHALSRRVLFPDSPVLQVTILPRGRAVGFVEQGADEGQLVWDRQHISLQVQVLLAGREAEELVLGQESLTSGCGNDLERATEMAVRFFTQWGLRPSADGHVLSITGLRQGLGLSHDSPLPASFEADIIGQSLTWLDQRRQCVRDLLSAKRDLLVEFARVVLDRETLYAEDIDQFFSTH